MSRLFEPIVPWYYEAPETYSADFILWQLAQ